MPVESKTTTERRCNHTLDLGNYPKQCRKCRTIVLDGNNFLSGDRRIAPKNNALLTSINEAVWGWYLGLKTECMQRGYIDEAALKDLINNVYAELKHG